MGGECAESKCNYFILEVPALQKGWVSMYNQRNHILYKKLKQSLEVEHFYIDGDMFVRKYPHIFDTENVDFMARGCIDPRAADNYQDSAGVMMDPHMFETSGGIMYFADSRNQSNYLNIGLMILKNQGMMVKQMIEFYL